MNRSIFKQVLFGYVHTMIRKLNLIVKHIKSMLLLLMHSKWFNIRLLSLLVVHFHYQTSEEKLKKLLYQFLNLSHSCFTVSNFLKSPISNLVSKRKGIKKCVWTKKCCAIKSTMNTCWYKLICWQKQNLLHKFRHFASYSAYTIRNISLLHKLSFSVNDHQL